MSVREQIFISSTHAVPEVAEAIAAVLGGRVSHKEGASDVLIATDVLLPGVAGEFGGPMLKRDPEWPYRPPGEWEATDAYDVELRLWQAYGPRVHPETGEDVEQAAASVVFRSIVSLKLPMLHVHDSDKLLSAFHPENGVQRFPKGTSIYDWDEDQWARWVLPSPAASPVE